MPLTNNTQFIATYDNTPFFEKAFRYAVDHQLIDQVRIDEILKDAATGTLQVTEYFRESIHLRKNLENSMRRMVGLVSLYLEDFTGSNLNKAAQILKEKPFRSLSRGGAQMLKALHALPDEDDISTRRLDSEPEFLNKNLTGKLNVAKYRQIFRDCERFKLEIDVAYWLADKIGTPNSKLNEFHVSANMVARTSLLFLAYGTKKIGVNKPGIPDEQTLFGIFASIRKEWSLIEDVACNTKFLYELPEPFQAYAKEILASIKNIDVPKIINTSQPIELIFNELKANKYFYLHDPFKGISQYDKQQAKDWYALVGDDEDETSILTLFLCVASGVIQKTTLEASDAKKAVLNIRKNGLLNDEVLKVIDKGPFEEIEQLKSLWMDFIEDASPFLLDESDAQLTQVVHYLSEHCNIKK